MLDEKDPTISFTAKELHVLRSRYMRIGILAGISVSLMCIAAAIVFFVGSDTTISTRDIQFWGGGIGLFVGSFLILLWTWVLARSEKRQRSYFSRFAMSNPPPEKAALEYT